MSLSQISDIKGEDDKENEMKKENMSGQNGFDDFFSDLSSNDNSPDCEKHLKVSTACTTNKSGPNWTSAIKFFEL